MKIPWTLYSTRVRFSEDIELAIDTMLIYDTVTRIEVITRNPLAEVIRTIIVDLLEDGILPLVCYSFLYLTQDEYRALGTNFVRRFIGRPNSITLLLTHDRSEIHVKLHSRKSWFYIQYDLENGNAFRIINEESYSIWVDGRKITGERRPTSSQV